MATTRLKCSDKFVLLIRLKRYSSIIPDKNFKNRPVSCLMKTYKAMKTTQSVFLMYHDGRLKRTDLTQQRRFDQQNITDRIE